MWWPHFPAAFEGWAILWDSYSLAKYCNSAIISNQESLLHISRCSKMHASSSPTFLMLRESFAETFVEKGFLRPLLRSLQSTRCQRLNIYYVPRDSTHKHTQTKPVAHHSINLFLFYAIKVCAEFSVFYFKINMSAVVMGKCICSFEKEKVNG